MYKEPAIPFKGTKAQELELKDFIELEKSERGALMPVLQKAQEIYGYLPIEVQSMVAEGLGISLSEVYGVATVSYTHLGTGDSCRALRSLSRPRL